jgi:hypothetical protein
MSLSHSNKNPDQQKTEVNRLLVKEGSTHNTPIFKDKRPETVVQKRAQHAADHSSIVNNQKNIQELTDQSEQVQKGKEVQNFINNSSHMVAQRKRSSLIQNYAIQRKQSEKQNKTGLPDNLKSGIEHLSGMDMSDVKVHYSSAKPSALNALAYAQGTDIHLGAGQEKHLAHEAWHVVQQKQGKVKPSMQMKGTAINDNEHLEKEADEMGNKAMTGATNSDHTSLELNSGTKGNTLQRKVFVGSKDAPKKITTTPKDLKDKGSGDKKIDSMVSDDIDRHFLDKKELENYVDNKTETIGVVDKEKTWVRLKDGELTVLGEAHTQTVLTDIAKAVNTSRFVYEPYNEVPADLTSTNTIQTTDNGKWESDAGIGSGDKVNHTMEFILPKLVFSLEYIKGVILQGKIEDFKKIKDEQYNIAERLAHYLSMAMSIAKDLAAENKDKLELVSIYKKNKDLFEATIKDSSGGTYLGDLKDMNKSTSNQNIVYDFCVAFIDYAIQDFDGRDKTESHDQKTKDAVEEIKKQNHTKDKKKAPRSEAANTWREYYMYQNVVKAKVLNYLLAGMGDAHRQDMEAQLNKVSGIKVLDMDDFVKNNKDNNDAVSKNAKSDKLTENEFRLMSDENPLKEETVAMEVKKDGSLDNVG